MYQLGMHRASYRLSLLSENLWVRLMCFVRVPHIAGFYISNV
jgi:hypothetical protein